MPTQVLDPIVKAKKGAILVARETYDLWKKPIADYLNGSYPFEVKYL